MSNEDDFAARFCRLTLECKLRRTQRRTSESYLP